MASQKSTPVLDDDADWELIDSDSTSLDIYSDALFLDVGAESGTLFQRVFLPSTDFLVLT